MNAIGIWVSWLTVHTWYRNCSDMIWLYILWCSFILLLAFVSIAIMLCWYGYANKNNNSNSVSNTDVVLQHDNMLPSHWIVLHFMRQRQKRRKLECVALFHAVVCRSAVYCHFPLDLHFATTQPCFCKDILHVFYKQHLMCLRFTCREKVTLAQKTAQNLIWAVRLKQISRNVIWIGFQTHIWM